MCWLWNIFVASQKLQKLQITKEFVLVESNEWHNTDNWFVLWLIIFFFLWSGLDSMNLYPEVCYKKHASQFSTEGHVIHSSIIYILKLNLVSIILSNHNLVQILTEWFILLPLSQFMENFIHNYRYYCCVVVADTADLTFYLAANLSPQFDFNWGSNV